MFYNFTDELVEGGKEVLDPDFVQPERRITAVHWIPRWVDMLYIYRYDVCLVPKGNKAAVQEFAC